MDDNRKKHGPVFWAIVALGVILGYPLSFGPACWISERLEDDGKVLSCLYSPVIRIFVLGKSQTARDMAMKYLYWGLRRNAHSSLSNGGSISWRYFGRGSYRNGPGGFTNEKINPLFERPASGGIAGFAGGTGRTR